MFYKWISVSWDVIQGNASQCMDTSPNTVRQALIYNTGHEFYAILWLISCHCSQHFIDLSLQNEPIIKQYFLLISSIKWEISFNWFLPSKIKSSFWASLVAQTVKNLPEIRETRFDLWVRKIPWRMEWQPTLLFLPGEVHGQRSLASCSPWGHKESDPTEQLSLSLCFFIIWFFLWEIPSSISQKKNRFFLNFLSPLCASCPQIIIRMLKNMGTIYVGADHISFCHWVFQLENQGKGMVQWEPISGSRPRRCCIFHRHLESNELCQNTRGMSECIHLCQRTAPAPPVLLFWFQKSQFWPYN